MSTPLKLVLAPLAAALALSACSGSPTQDSTAETGSAGASASPTSTLAGEVVAGEVDGSSFQPVAEVPSAPTESPEIEVNVTPEGCLAYAGPQMEAASTAEVTNGFVIVQLSSDTSYVPGYRDHLERCASYSSNMEGAEVTGTNEVLTAPQIDGVEDLTAAKNVTTAALETETVVTTNYTLVGVVDGTVIVATLHGDEPTLEQLTPAFEAQVAKLKG